MYSDGLNLTITTARGGAVASWEENMLNRYDPKQAPDPVEWLELDEQVRLGLVEKYHRAARIKPPNRTAHATIHTIVENQIAEGHAPAVRAMARLTAGGLSRHDAIHAIGAVLAEYLFDALRGGPDAGDGLAARCDAAVERLTAESWRRMYG